MHSPTVLLLTLALLVPAVAHADPNPYFVPFGNHVGKVTLPLSTTVVDPNTLENVQISGSILVKTVIKYVPGNPVKVLTSFKLGKDAAAIGLASGNPYTLKGNGAVKYKWSPESPIKSVDHTGILVVIPPNPVIPGNPVVPGNPVRLHYHVDFDAVSGDVSGSFIDFPGNPILNTCTPIAQVCN